MNQAMEPDWIGIAETLFEAIEKGFVRQREGYMEMMEDIPMVELIISNSRCN